MDYTNPNASQTIPQEDINRGKTIAILAYCTLIGFIIAIIMHQSEKTKYGAFHIRQALGLLIFGVGGVIVLMAIGVVLWFLWFLVPLVQLTLLVFLILGIVNAASGKAQFIPLIGKLSDKMLSGIQQQQVKKAGDYFLNFLSATPIVWISCCYLLYLLNFNPRIFAHETLDELFIYWFLPYYVLIGIPLWLILLAYKALRKEYTKRIVVTHVAIFAIGFAILYLMLELNPNGWVNAYFD